MEEKIIPTNPKAAAEGRDVYGSYGEEKSCEATNDETTKLERIKNPNRNETRKKGNAAKAGGNEEGKRQQDWKRFCKHLTILACLTICGGIASLGATRSLKQQLARSGMPPHPGPQEVELTNEQMACIVTNRQKAIHRANEKAKRTEEETQKRKEKEEEEGKTTEKQLTEEQLRRIEKNKAKALRRIARAEARKEVDGKIARMDQMIHLDEQKMQEPIKLDLTGEETKLR